MRKTQKRKAATRPLVLGYLERIASSAFSEFPKQITDLVHGRHGVYALYKGDRLYYVGLATNLRNRIKQHLRDKHAGKWNRFSLYLVRKVEHIKELESMILRIADPKGNATRGGLPGADNLWSNLHSAIRKEQEIQIEKLFGYKKLRRKRKTSPHLEKQKATKANDKVKKRENDFAALAKANGITRLQGVHRKITHKARVLQDGKIRYKRKTYNSPSIAGRDAVGRRTCNGWMFWKYEKTPGNWVKINTLRK